MDKTEPCTISLRGLEWVALIKVYAAAQELLECVQFEPLLRRSTAEAAGKLKAAYRGYGKARAIIEEQYMQRDTLNMKLRLTEPVEWLIEQHGYHCQALDELVAICKQRKLTISRWKSKIRATNKCQIRWAVHHGNKALRLEYQGQVIAWFTLDAPEYINEPASKAAFEQMLIEVRERC